MLQGRRSVWMGGLVLHYWLHSYVKGEGRKEKRREAKGREGRKDKGREEREGKGGKRREGREEG